MMGRLLKGSVALLFRRQSTILSAALVIMITYGLSFILGLFKTWLLVRFFFQSPTLLDTYYAATTIPEAIFQIIVTGSLSAAFIPVFSQSLARDQKKAWKMAATLLNLVLLFLLVISSLIFVLAPLLVHKLSPGFGPAQIDLEARLLRLMLLPQFFFAISGFLTAVLQTHRHFLLPAVAPLVYNLSIIGGTLFLAPTLGIFGPAIGMLIGSFLHFLIQWPLADKLGFKFSPQLDLKLNGVSEVIKLFPPRVFTLAIDQIEQFSATIISSFLVTGSLTLFNLAKTLSFLPVTLFGVSLGQASLPALSGYSNGNKLAKFQKSLAESLLQIAFLVAPISILFIVMRVQLVRLAFGAPTLPWSATILTGQVLAILAVSALFSAAIQLLVRGFYALHDTKTPLFTGLGAAILNVATSLVLSIQMRWGVTGIATAWTLAAFGECVVLLFLLLWKLKFSVINFFPSLSKILIAGFSTAFALWLPMRFLDRFVFDTTRTLPLFFLTAISGLIGFLVYLAMAYMFRVEELWMFLGVFRRLRARL